MAANPLRLTETDLKLMLAAETHLGSRNCDRRMADYVWRRRRDGVYIINIGMTWEKLMLAARIIVTVENPSDVIAVSGNKFGQRSVFKFAQHTGAQYIGSRYTPGTFSNQGTRNFTEPRLLIVTDPITDFQPVKEASYMNIPCIALCDTDASLQYVDVAIPCNNKGKKSIALMYWLLAREILRMRTSISRADPWEVVYDLFLYRDPETKAEEDEEEHQEIGDAYEAPPAQDATEIKEWGNEQIVQPFTEWAAEPPVPVEPIPAADWTPAGAAAPPTWDGAGEF